MLSQTLNYNLKIQKVYINDVLLNVFLICYDSEQFFNMKLEKTAFPQKDKCLLLCNSCSVKIILLALKGCYYLTSCDTEKHLRVTLKPHLRASQ